jgi:uncharacterized protein YneF (UPF0154 family)
MSKSFLWLVTVGVATWVAAASTGQLIVFATGVPASSSLLNGFLVPFLLVFGILPSKSKFPVTIAFTVYGILATFTVLLGPPGAQKIPVAFVAGLITDGLIFLMRKQSKIKEPLMYSIAFAVWGALLAALARVLYTIMDLQGKEQFFAYFNVMVIVFVVGAIIGSFAAVTVYRKSKFAQNPLIRRLHESEA